LSNSEKRAATTAGSSSPLASAAACRMAARSIFEVGTSVSSRSKITARQRQSDLIASAAVLGV